MTIKAIITSGNEKNDINTKRVWIAKPLSIKSMTHDEFFERRNGAGRTGSGSCSGAAGR